MSFFQKKGPLLSAAALIFCAAAAGQLFPPINLEKCLAGGVLTWSNVGDGGHVECIANPGGIPSGAIMAFALEACPSGWTAVPWLSGRTIIGSGTGAGLSHRPYGVAGGAETHTLTVAEMPSHNHSPIHLRGSQSDNGNPGQDVITNWTGEEVWGSSDIIDSYTGYAGGGGAHNTMMPYIALTYCRKD